MTLQDAQDPSDDVSTNGIEPAYSDEEEEKILGKKYQRRQPTLTLEQEKLFDLEVSIPKGRSEKVSVTEDLSIAFRKAKGLC